MSENVRLINGINDFILDNLSERVSIDEVSAVFEVSKFHLHRIFFQATGFDLAEYIDRRKMEQAVVLLRQGQSVIEVALSVGYESHSSFSRAFRKTYGFSPSKLDDKHVPSPIILHKKKSSKELERIEFKRVKRRACRIIGSFVSPKDKGQLSALANDVFTHVLDCTDSHNQLTDAIGVSMGNPWIESPNAPAFFFGFANAQGDVPKSLHTISWEAGYYATTVYVGSHQYLWQFISRCHAHISADRTFELTSRSIFQHYLNSPNATPEHELKTQLYFPIVK